MSIEDNARRVRETLRAVRAEADLERSCIAALRDGGYLVEYITRREANARRLDAAVVHLQAALDVLK